MKIRIIRDTDRNDTVYYFEVGKVYKSWFGFGKEKIKWIRPEFNHTGDHIPYSLSGMNGYGKGWPFRNINAVEKAIEKYLNKSKTKKEIVKEFDYDGQSLGQD